MTTNLQDAYIAVEHAYSMQQFPEALRLAQDLVPRIPSGSEDQLDLRLQLLIGHTYLYGLGQPMKALPCYQQVLKLSYDPTYRELAEQGMTLCQQAGATLAATGSQDASPTAATNAVDGPSSSSSGAAVPWLEDLGSLDTTGQAGHDGPPGQAWVGWRRNGGSPTLGNARLAASAKGRAGRADRSDRTGPGRGD